MKELWRKTAKLFLNYPILWLPYLCACLLNSSLEMLRHAMRLWIFYWLSTRRSVLGGPPIQIDSDFAGTQAFWITGAMEWSLRYLFFCLDTLALVATAALVTMIVRGEQPRLRAALEDLRGSSKRILVYSFKLFFLFLAFATFVRLLLFPWMHWGINSATTAGWSRITNFALTQGQAFISVILFAWIITPITIRLLRVPDAEPPSAGEKKLGRYFSILTGVCAIALEAALFPLLLRLVSLRQFPKEVFASLVSVVLSFPFSVLGLIGLALIAAGGEWNIGETPAQRKWWKMAQVLMPLHFRAREER